MQTIVHKANERGHANHGWLQSYHSFSFASYYDPEKMGVGKLRVINDDTVAPSGGFGTHPHENMEIVSIPLAGALEHKDSMGNKHIIHAGEVQAMSAGTGITHSEYNHSDQEPVKFLQIWIMPKHYGIEPRYDQKKFDTTQRQNKWQVIVSPLESGEKDTVRINQDAWFSLAQLDATSEIGYTNHAQDNVKYIFVIKGELTVNQQTLTARDAMAVLDNDNIEMKAVQQSEILVIETPQ